MTVSEEDMQLDNPMLDFSATSAALGGACRNTVKQYVRDGKLAPAKRLGRRLYWRASEVAAAVDVIMAEAVPENWCGDSATSGSASSQAAQSGSTQNEAA